MRAHERRYTQARATKGRRAGRATAAPRPEAGGTAPLRACMPARAHPSSFRNLLPPSRGWVRSSRTTANAAPPPCRTQVTCSGGAAPAGRGRREEGAGPPAGAPRVRRQRGEGPALLTGAPGLGSSHSRPSSRRAAPGWALGRRGPAQAAAPRRRAPRQAPPAQALAGVRHSAPLLIIAGVAETERAGAQDMSACGAVGQQKLGVRRCLLAKAIGAHVHHRLQVPAGSKSCPTRGGCTTRQHARGGKRANPKPRSPCSPPRPAFRRFRAPQTPARTPPSAPAATLPLRSRAPTAPPPGTGCCSSGG